MTTETGDYEKIMKTKGRSIPSERVRGSEVL